MHSGNQDVFVMGAVKDSDVPLGRDSRCARQRKIVS